MVVRHHVDRFVGRRTGAPDTLAIEGSREADAEAWRRAFGGPRIRRGVYRFHTHDEADEWLGKMIARPTPN